MINIQEVHLANPRGFCAGVVRAIATVRLALEKHGAPVYVLHEIVHNKHVVQELIDQGTIFVKKLSEVPKGSICIFSAHGVSMAMELKAEKLGLRTINATCPLVSSVHRMVCHYHEIDYDVLIIGHHGHPEVEGSAGRVEGRVQVVATEEEAAKIKVTDPAKVAFVTQTTLGQDEIAGIRKILEDRFPMIKGPGTNVCYATQNRQNAVKDLARITDLLFVVGSKNSSNSNRLREIGERKGVTGYLIDDINDIRPEWFEGKKRLGITAGASAPERLVKGVVDWLRDQGVEESLEQKGKEETVVFKPAGLQ